MRGNEHGCAVWNDLCYKGKALPYVAIHACSGPRRATDFAHAISSHAFDVGIAVVCLVIDPAISKVANLLALVGQLSDLIIGDRVIALLNSPPCSTVTRARHVPLTAEKHGPRPLRIRDDPFEPIFGLSKYETTQVQLGNYLLYSCVYLQGLMTAMQHWGLTEHPKDPWPPFPSFFHSRAATLLRTFGDCDDIFFDQCMFGAWARKSTQ